MLIIEILDCSNTSGKDTYKAYKCLYKHFNMLNHLISIKDTYWKRRLSTLAFILF